MFLFIKNIRAGTMLAALLLTAGIALIQAENAISQTGSTAGPKTWSTPRFPLEVSPNGRYLVDSTGTPFLIHGDTAWSLIAQLKREDAERYLDDRRARGFNAILVNLLEHRFTTNPPKNAYSQSPFLTPGDFSTPNEEYFAHAAWVLQRARERGILVLLAPAYLGVGGGQEGWHKAMLTSGPAKLKTFGEFLGKRFGGFPNILWVNGGDYNPPQKTLVRSIVEGIRAIEPNALHTAHGAPGTAAIDYWQGEPWLTVNNVYTYDPVYAPALAQYTRRSPMPFFLIESAYENEHHATELRIRTQAYHALLSGASGHVYGNNPIWHFDGPGLYPAPIDWQHALRSRGAESMTHLAGLFSAFDWWALIPDSHNRFLLRTGLSGDGITGDAGSGHHRSVAARARDGSFGLVYLPEPRPIAIDLATLNGPNITARWFDPANGSFIPAVESPLIAGEKRRFMPPGNNRSGYGDWVLLLQSHP